MIKIITLDPSGDVVSNHDARGEEVTLPVILADPVVLADVVHLHPGVPSLGSAGFTTWLEAWHTQGNPQGVPSNG